MRSIDVDSISPMGPSADGDAASELQLMRATIRINTIIFSLILGAGFGVTLLVLSLVAAEPEDMAASPFF